MERRALIVEEPAAPGVYQAVGTLFFNPGVLNSTHGVRVLTVPGSNIVDLILLDSRNWPGDGLMSVTVAFLARHDRSLRRRYVVEQGEGRWLPATELDRSIPTLRFEAAEPGEMEDPTLPVGTMFVKVRKCPEVYYYWYLLPIAGIIALLLYRRFRYFR